MSLINEALKRADQERRRATRATGSEPPPQAEPAPAPPYARLRAVMVLSAFALIAIAIVTWISIPPQPTGHAPARGTAATPGRTNPDGTTQVKMKPAPVAPDAEYRLPVRLDLAQEPPAPAARVRESLAALGSYRPAATPTPAPVEPTPRTPAEAARPAEPTPAEPARTLPAPTPAAPAPLNPEDFLLGAILRADRNSHALINNQLVGIGDRVNGAKVVEIGKYHVTIEKDGRRLTLRM